MYSSKTHELMEKAHEQKQGAGFRNHLGGSVIGRPCARQLWYIFRWVRRSFFPARVLRLFQRGNNEEEVLAKYLRSSGIHCVTENPETGKQFRIEDHDGHFGGSLDAVLYDAPDFPGDWILGEFKTHNNKSFNQLKKQGITKSKYEHLIQTQIYMHYTGLKHAIYFAVNKDNDDLHTVVVDYDIGIAERYIDRAQRIINARVPPDRIANASPGYWICRFCDYKEICHHSEPKQMNCRTCVHSHPVTENRWFCDYHRQLITTADQKVGCLSHTPIPED